MQWRIIKWCKWWKHCSFLENQIQYLDRMCAISFSTRLRSCEATTRNDQAHCGVELGSVLMTCSGFAQLRKSLMKFVSSTVYVVVLHILAAFTLVRVSSVVCAKVVCAARSKIHEVNIWWRNMGSWSWPEILLFVACLWIAVSEGHL